MLFLGSSCFDELNFQVTIQLRSCNLKIQNTNWTPTHQLSPLTVAHFVLSTVQ